MTDIADARLPRPIRLELRRASAILLAFLAAAAAWAVLAPITSTISVFGSLTSTELSYRLQHEEGGEVAQVHVQLHDRVAAGDLIFAFDRTALLLAEAAAARRLEQLEAERAEAERRLAGRAGSESGSVVALEFAERDAVLAAQIEQWQSRAETAIGQIASTTEELAVRERHLELARVRLERAEALFERGAISETQLNDQQSDFLAAELDFTRQNTELEALAAERESAFMQLRLLQAEYRQELAMQVSVNSLEIDLARSELSRLSYQIERGVLRAPVSGMVTQLPVSTPGRVVGPGELLAVISQPLDEFHIEFTVPARYIDQVFPGQTGRMMVDAISQREAPDLPVTVTALAEEPVVDENGAVSYSASAVLEADAAGNLRDTLREGAQIVRGMPVTVILEGRETTLWQYISDPLVQSWSNAFED